MIKSKRHLTVKTIEVIIEHPLPEIGEVPMFISFLSERNEYIFSFPIHKWTHTLRKGEEISLVHGPGPFNHNEYKSLFEKTLIKGISLLETE
jgi:hypothetical protein